MTDASNPASAGNDPGAPPANLAPTAPPANRAPTAPPAEVLVLVAATTQGDVTGPVTHPGFAPPVVPNEVDMADASNPANAGNDPVAPPAEVPVLVAAPTQGDVPGPITAPDFAPPVVPNEVDMADASIPANAGYDPVVPPANPAPTAPPAEVPVLVPAPAHDDVPGPVAAPTQGDVPGPVTHPGFAPPAAPSEVDIAGIWLPDPSQADYMFIINLPKLSR